MPVIPKDGGPWSLYCTDCGVWTPNTANGEMKKEGFYAHSHVCGHMQKDEISDEDFRRKTRREKRDRGMTYLGAIKICNKIEEHSEEEALQAIEKILGMETINAVSKEALLNVVRWFWKRCVTTTEEAEAEE